METQELTKAELEKLCEARHDFELLGFSEWQALDLALEEAPLGAVKDLLYAGCSLELAWRIYS